jgi:hypothetical protein
MYGAADLPLSASTLARRKCPSIRLSKKKNQAWGLVELELMQAMKRGF